MKNLIFGMILFFVLKVPVLSADQYQPNTGDAELDTSLQYIDKIFSKKSQFVDKVAEEFKCQSIK